MHFEFAYCSFFPIHLDLKRQIRSWTLTRIQSLEKQTLIQTKIGKAFARRFQTKKAHKPYPLGRHIRYL